MMSGVRAVCRALVILYLLAGLAWTITGFYWIFSSRQQPGLGCGHDSLAYWVRLLMIICVNKCNFAFDSLALASNQ